MSYCGDKETYVPKFKVGDVVRHDLTSPDVQRTITGRKVTRNAKRCETYYELDNRSDVWLLGAWETFLQPVSELLEPYAVLARILPMFEAPGRTYTLTAGTDKVGLVISAESWIVKFFAMPENGKVQTLGEWDWHVLKPSVLTLSKWSAQSGTAPNLGGAVVDASNTLNAGTITGADDLREFGRWIDETGEAMRAAGKSY